MVYGARKLSTCDIYKAVKHEMLQIRNKEKKLSNWHIYSAKIGAR